LASASPTSCRLLGLAAAWVRCIVESAPLIPAPGPTKPGQRTSCGKARAALSPVLRAEFRRWALCAAAFHGAHKVFEMLVLQGLWIAGRTTSWCAPRR
jgi:hypothetical protein